MKTALVVLVAVLRWLFKTDSFPSHFHSYSIGKGNEREVNLKMEMNSEKGNELPKKEMNSQKGNGRETNWENGNGREMNSGNGNERETNSGKMEMSGK